MRLKLILAIVLLTVFGGCTTQEQFTRRFPPNSKNVKSLGNGWYTFELDVDGKTKKFICLGVGLRGGLMTNIGDSP